ncbi:MAG: methyltransferase domain-containing protein [bacterium]|nr:methyltransferase domain-containing protein [bacterium]
MTVTDYAKHWQRVYRQAYAEGVAHWRPALATPREFIDFMSSGLAPAPRSRILEAGCGDGLNCISLAERGYRVVGVDIVPAAIEHSREVAKSRGTDVAFACRDLAEALPIDGPPFDLWIDIKVLHCLWEDAARAQYLANAFDALKPGGALFLNCGLALADVRDYLPGFFSRLDETTRAQAMNCDRTLAPEARTGIRCETLAHYCGECESAGFEVLRAGRCGGAASGWGAVIIARRSAGDSRALPSILPLADAPPPRVEALPDGPQGETTYERHDCLNVKAHESNVWRVVADVADGTTERLAKRYNEDIAPERVQGDADLLHFLADARLPVPEVLCVTPEDRLLTISYCGDLTLSDLLAEGREPPWHDILRQLARLHTVLSTEWTGARDASEWRFTPEQRLAWADAALANWLEWLDLRSDKAGPLREAALDRVQRLARCNTDAQVIWGDCNPKNIVMSEQGFRLIDFQPKRSSIMMDLVLLFTFADAPHNYVPRDLALNVLPHYFDAIAPDLIYHMSWEAFSTWYDDELLWRILVYGSSLLRGRDQRLACWEPVCRKMASDLLALTRDSSLLSG